jgi:hypothetical protein
MIPFNNVWADRIRSMESRTDWILRVAKVESHNQSRGPFADVLRQPQVGGGQLPRRRSKCDADRAQDHLKGIVAFMGSPFGMSLQCSSEPFKDCLALRQGNIAEPAVHYGFHHDD